MMSSARSLMAMSINAREIVQDHPFAVALVAIATALGLTAILHPSLTFYHIDDIWQVPWAGQLSEFGQNGQPYLEAVIPNTEDVFILPRFHILTLAGFFELFGFSPQTLDAYRAIAFLAFTGALIFFALRLELPALALFAPACAFATSGYFGSRFEITALPIFFVGVAYLFGVAAITLRERLFAKALIVISPTIATSLLAFGIGAILVRDLLDLPRRGVLQIGLENIGLLLFGIVFFGATARFDYPELISQFGGFLVAFSEYRALSAFNTRGVVTALILGVAAYILWRRKHNAWAAFAFMCASLTVGLILYHKAVINNAIVPYFIAAFILILAKARVDDVKWIAIAAVTTVFLHSNYIAYAFAKTPSPEAKTAAIAFSEEQIALGKRVHIDSSVYRYAFNFPIEGYSSFDLRYSGPEFEPEDITLITQGEAWLFTKQALFGFKHSFDARLHGPGQHPLGRQLDGYIEEYKTTPIFHRIYGSRRARFTAIPWSYVGVTRNADSEIVIYDFAAGTENVYAIE
ncbi:MAG: hypothetical protein AAGC77_01595 [Pseudomonadota bacterium]